MFTIKIIIFFYLIIILPLQFCLKVIEHRFQSILVLLTPNKQISTMKSLTHLFILITTIILVKSVEFPTDITMCDRSTPEFRECMNLMVEDLRSRFKTGYPALGIPPVDPMKFKEVFFRLSTFNVTAKNIEISGTSDFVLKNLDMTTNKDEIKVEIFLPHATASSDYHIAGKLLMIDLNADGSAKFDIDGVTGSILIKLKRVKRDGKEYVSFVSHQTDVNVKKIKVELDRLFGDNVELTRTTNQLINENIDDFVQQFQPLVSEMVGGFIVGMFTPIFTQFPVETLKYFN